MSRITRLVAPALAAALVLGVIGATGCKPVDKSVVATVNGVPIKIEQIDTQIVAAKKASPQIFETSQSVAVEAEYRAKILDSLIQLELVNQAAKTLGVSVTDKQVDDYIKQLEQQYGGKAGLDDAIKQAGVDLNQVKVSVKSRLLVEAVTKKAPGDVAKVTDAQIKAYYDANKVSFSVPVEVDAQHILFKSADKKIAQTVLAQVKKGADFAALAKKYSTDPGSKDKGGNLGWAPSSQYVPEFAAAVEKMKKGEYRLVQSQFGWHIIKLIDKRGGSVKTLAEVTGQIKTNLETQAQAANFGKYIEELKKKAKIEILDPVLKKAVDALQTSGQGGATPAPNQ
jgi:foldase protein PrsA